MEMYKFAHMSDCHIGVWRDQRLRNLNLQAFQKAIDKCIEEKVDFIIISGDLFDTNIPDLYQVKSAVEKLRLAKENGINIYAIYGSHDYNPNTVSMVDVLESTGLFVKVSKGEFQNDKLVLEFVEDEKTGAKLTGLPGRKLGLESEYFKTLDKETLEKVDGFKIFLFHTIVTELNPGYPEANTVPLSLFPKGFDYYAGGNIHKRIEERLDDYSIVVYPGALFGTNFKDLEDMANGEKRGFYIVEFDKTVKNVRFVEIKVSDVVYHVLDASNKTARQVEEELTELAESIEVQNKIVLLRVLGMMSSGRPVDIDFRKIKEMILERGAIYANINRYALTTKEKIEVKVKGESKKEIEQRILNEKMAEFKVDPSIKDKTIRKFLESTLTAELAEKLLNALKIEPKEGETKKDFQSRLLRDILDLTKLEGPK
jgi:hypothetical protein